MSGASHRQEPKRNDQAMDSQILALLEAYGAAAIPIDRIAQALSPDGGNVREQVEERLLALAEEGCVRRSRVLADRWLAAPSRPLAPT